MLNFRFSSDTPVVAAIAARAKDTTGLLRQWGAMLRTNARDVIAGGTLAPLAPSTLAKYSNTGTASITAQAKVRSDYAKRLDQTLKRKGSEDARADLKRVLSGNLSKGTSGNKTVDRLRRRLAKAQAGQEIGAKVAIGKKKSEKHKLLGKVAGAFKLHFERGLRVTVENMVAYSQVLNVGGNVGKGGKSVLPERKFLDITPQARAHMAQMALDWLLGGKK